MIPCVVNIRHKHACVSQIPTIPALAITLLHRYQNKHVITPLFSHTCAHLRLYPLCFDMLQKNTRGGVAAPLPTVPSRFGMGSGSRHTSHKPRVTNHPLLSPIIPAHPGGSPVTPIIPALTQTRGWGGVIRMVTYLKYVGAPTFSLQERPASEGRALQEQTQEHRQEHMPVPLGATC
jgi:hypothetical protein